MTLRQLLERSGPVIAPGVSDAITARLVESIGFPALYLGGWVAGAALGTSEPLLTLSEMVGLASIITRSVGIPLIVDAGAGWGEPLHVQRTVREMERAGVQAIHIEDQVFPKRARYFRGQKDTIDKERMAEKIRAAVAARRSRDFLIIARTDAWKPDDPRTVNEVVERLHMYVEAGADAVMPMVKDPRYLPLLAREFRDTPIVWTHYFGGLTVQEVAEQGGRLIIFPQAPLLCALHATRVALQELRERGRLESYDSEWMNRGFKQELLRLLGMDAFWQLEDETLGPGESWGRST